MADQTSKYPAVAPYLMVDDGVAAIEFYKRAFAAQERDRYEYEGKIGHVGLSINGGEVMLSDEYPEFAEVTGNSSPKTLGGTTTSINMAVDDVDAWYARALAAGGTTLREPRNEFYGRQAKLRDPFGHVWGLVGPTKDA